MKIKRPPRKSPSTNPEIAAFILTLSSQAEDELPALLSPIIIAGWNWPRTDLQHWIAPLNRFDTILEQVINDYDLATMEHCQTNDFTPRTRELLASILKFEKMLLENSTNRKIFASFDRLNDLLRTTDTFILLATLRLALRPAQQFSTQHSAQQNHTFAISEGRLLTLAQGWSTREFGLDMINLAQDTLDIPAGMEEVEWTYYKRLEKPVAGGTSALTERGKEEDVPQTVEKKDKGRQVIVEDMDVEGEPASIASGSGPVSAIPSTPAPKPRATFAQGSLLATPIPATPATNPNPSGSDQPVEGLTTVHLGTVQSLAAQSTVDVLLSTIATHSVPTSERLNLLHKIRVSQSLIDATQRRSLLVIRLLAIAVFAHSTTTSNVQAKLFLYEPELISQLADLVHPDPSEMEISVEIQAAAFYALEGIAKFKTKIGEVASALNAGVSHGILMGVLRKTVKDMESDEPVSSEDFIDALFNILTFFQTSAFVGNMIVGAGVVNILVEYIKNTRRDRARLELVTRAVLFLDGLMYGYAAAFTNFIAAGGLPLCVERIKSEVNSSVETLSSAAALLTHPVDSPTGLLSWEQASLLKSLLRAIQRLMQTAGTTEGLRNLIDSSLLSSIKQIMIHREIFGSQLFGLAINITATFVHNEPTCLTTIQEARVPEALYDAIENYIPPFIDVLQAIPNAIGALCLNAAGLAQLNARPLITKYLSVFTSEKHVKILQDRDNANMIGGAIDELMRHHPSLKDKILAGVVDILTEIKLMGEVYDYGSKSDGYALRLDAVEVIVGNEAVGDVTMEVEEGEASKKEETSKDAVKPEELDNPVLCCIDVMGRFLEGLFQNISHAKDFAKFDPIPILLDLVALKSTPSLGTTSPAFTSLTAVFRIMSDIKAAEIAVQLLKKIDLMLEVTKDLWEKEELEPKLGALSITTVDNFEKANGRFRALGHLLSYIALLSDLYSSLTYNHGRIATSVLAVLAQPTEAAILLKLGQFWRACLWESTESKESVLAAITKPTLSSVTDVTEAPQVAALKGPDSEVLASGAVGLPDSYNFKALLSVIWAVPTNCTTLFQAVIKLLVHRRSVDAVHVEAAKAVVETVAVVMTLHLEWRESGKTLINLAYTVAMVESTATLLFDDRSAATGLQTYLLIAFQRMEGLEKYLGLYTRYQESANTLYGPVVLDGHKPELSELSVATIQALAGLKVTLQLLQRITSHRVILESTQTALLLSRQKDQSSEYFEPHRFLLRIRATVLPVIEETWNLTWLNMAPHQVVRALVGTLINILRAEGETSTEPVSNNAGGLSIASRFAGELAGLFGAVGGVGGAAPGPPALPAPFVLDEDRVSQLVDMGFPRSAVVSILTRCRNNVGLATEYLLQRPELVAAARVADASAALAAANAPPAPVPVVAEVPAVEAPPVVEDAVMEEAEVPAVAEVEVVPEVAAEVEATPEVPFVDAKAESDERAKKADAAFKLAEEIDAKLKAELDVLRNHFKTHFLSRAVTLAEGTEDLVFDIVSAFSLFSTNAEDKVHPTLQPLLDDLSKLMKLTSMNPSQERAIATRLRIMALLAADAATIETVHNVRENLMSTLMVLHQLYMAKIPDKDSRPGWLSSAMLLADSLFTVAEAPQVVTILAEGEVQPSTTQLLYGPSWFQERQSYFELAMSVLSTGISTREVFISTLRLLLVCTRDYNLAAQFGQKDGVNALFEAFAKERPETKGCRSYAVMILRHVVEDKALLRATMEKEIEGWFNQPRAKVADVTAFLRGTSSIAFRDVEVFLEATKATCKLARADTAGTYHLGLINENPRTPKSLEVENAIKSPFAAGEVAEGPAQMETDDVLLTKPSKSIASVPASAVVEGVVHFLISEIVETSKVALASTAIPVPSLSTITSTEAPVESIPTVDSTKKEAAELPADLPMNEFFQMTFCLSSLTELISCYPSCKASLLSYSTRRSSKDVPLAAPKPRASFLYFLLNEVLPVENIMPSTEFDPKKRSSLSSWASLVFIGLCFDSESTTLARESPSDIVAVRKVALDAITRAFKDVTASSESTDIRYGRLFALSELCNRLLTQRPFPGNTKIHDETSMQLAKLMLERNFAVILTNALADVDLNFPYVSNLINAILRPLEQLTKVVTKVGRSSTAPSAKRPIEEDSSASSSFSDDDEIEVDSEDGMAPDLYRNSALGMYEGELEPGHQEDSYMSGGSEEEYDEDDEMMEMEDGVIPGSDISDASDEDDDDEGAVAFEEEIEMLTDEEEDSQDDEDSESDGDSIGSEGELEYAETELEGIGAEFDVEGALEDGEDEGEAWIDEDDQEEIVEDMDAGFFDDDGAGRLHDEDDGDSEGPDTEDEMFLTGELEFDADMTEQMAVARRGGPGRPPREATGGSFFGWDAVGSGEDNAGRRNRALADDLMNLTDANMYGAQGRDNGPPPTAVHPLLMEAVTNETRSETPRRQRGGQSRAGHDYEAWVQSIENMIGPGAGAALQELLNQHGISQLADPAQIRVGLAPGPDGVLAMVIDPSAAINAAQGGGGVGGPGFRRTAAPVPSPSAPRPSRVLSDRINSTSDYLPLPTVQRWQEESRLSQASIVVAERVARLVNHLINVLHPAARLEAQKAKVQQKEADDLAKLRQKEVEEAENVKKLAEAQAALQQTAADAASASATSIPSEEMPVLETIANEVPATTAPESTTSGEQPMEDDLAAVMNLARSLAVGFNPSGTTLLSSTAAATPALAVSPAPSASEPASSANAVASTSSSSSEPIPMESEDEAGPVIAPVEAATVERVTIVIHGETVDITDTGIDPTFLEALPDDMREEVLNQHFREARTAVPAPAVPSQINSEFLDALPPDLRAEVLRQEAAEQRREQAAARQAAGNDDDDDDEDDEAGGPSDIDPADFFASLDPQLRQAVLMEQDDGFLQTLTPNLIAEANLLRTVTSPRRVAATPAQAARPVVAAAVKKTPVHREAIQLLDKSGLATLVRLLFFPQPLKKNLLQKVLVHLCENSRTRTELINLLLTILQDGTRDVFAVDKSFSQMSLRASKSLGGPKETPRKKGILETPGGGLPNFPSESVPNLIAQRCLEALMFLVSSNDQSPLFFLTEQEIVVGLHRRSSKKGKGKEKAVSTAFPIVVLMNLLDRPALLKTQSMTDGLTMLLSAITKPLSVLQEKPIAEDSVIAKAGEAVSGSEQPVTADAGPSISAVQADLAAASLPDATTPSADPAVVVAPDASLPVPAVETAKESVSAEVLIKNPPQLSPSVLRLVVNILTAGECSSKTFQNTLNLIQNLSYLAEAREVITEELRARAQSLADLLHSELDELLIAVNSTEDVRGSVLANFSSPSSRQAKLLRILKTIDLVYNLGAKKPTTAPDLKALVLSKEEAKVVVLYESFEFGTLWEKLGDVLSAVEVVGSEKEYVASTLLLPLVEALLQISKYAFHARIAPVEEKTPVVV